MQSADLKFPGTFTNAGAIRREVAHAISQLEQDTNPEAFLAEFLADAATKTPGYTAPTLPATEAIVEDGEAVPVVNSAGTAVAGTHSATVTASEVTNIKLAATIAPVASGLVADVTVTGTGTKLALTVAGGKITAAVLSE